MVPCPGCSDKNHLYNNEDPFSVGFIAGFHHQEAVGYVGAKPTEMRDYCEGVRRGSLASKGLLVQQELFSDMC